MAEPRTVAPANQTDGSLLPRKKVKGASVPEESKVVSKGNGVLTEEELNASDEEFKQIRQKKRDEADATFIRILKERREAQEAKERGVQAQKEAREAHRVSKARADALNRGIDKALTPREIRQQKYAEQRAKRGLDVAEVQEPTNDKVGAWWRYSDLFTFKGASKVSKSLLSKTTTIGKFVLFMPIALPMLVTLIIYIGVIGLGVSLVDESFRVGLLEYGLHGIAAVSAVFANLGILFINSVAVGAIVIYRIALVGVVESIQQGLTFIFGQFFGEAEKRWGIDNPVQAFEDEKEGLIEKTLNSDGVVVQYVRPGIGGEPFLVPASQSTAGPFDGVFGPVQEALSSGGAALDSAKQFVQDAVMTGIEGLTAVAA